MQQGEVISDVFVGRELELGDLAAAVSRVQEGQPWLVTIEGQSGVGKTALTRRALAEISGLTVLSARADPAESDLDHGIVDQLVRGVDAALLAQFPLLAGGGGTASPFAVGAQFLGVIGELQTKGAVAVVVDDLQWCDKRSMEALTFAFRRLTVDAVLVVLVVRGDTDLLDQTARRLIGSIDRRLPLRLLGLRVDDVAPLAAALGAGTLDGGVVQSLYEATGGHTLYLRTILAEGFGSDRPVKGPIPLPPSLTAAIRDHLALLPVSTRIALEMLSVLNMRLPMARLRDAADIDSPASAIEPAVAAGLVDWWPEEPTCPVALKHALVRDAIYAGMTATNRRNLHARAVPIVDESASWAHRVASLDGPDEKLAAELEDLAFSEAAHGRLAIAARHLLWASDVTPARADRERRQLTAAAHLMLVDEAVGLELRSAVEAASPSPLRDCVLGTMAFARGQLGDAETRLTEALARADANPANGELAAVISNRLSGTYTLMGDGEKVIEFGRRALETGTLDAAAASQTRTLIAIGTSQVRGPRAALAELGHLEANPARVGPVHIDGLAFRGVFHLLAGSLSNAVQDLSASVRMLRQGVSFTLGSRAYVYLALAQYLAGAWDDVLLTAEQAFAAAGIHARYFELPMLHLAAGCVPAGRGITRDADEHASAAEQAAATLDYGQERLYAAMARALVHQAAGNYSGMAEVMDPWRDETDLDGRTRVYGVLWRPLLVEGLIGSGRASAAASALESLQLQGGDVEFLQPGLAWLEGWLAEQRGAPEAAQVAYERGAEVDTGTCPVYSAQLSLAHGRLLRRTGNRRGAVERLRRASSLFGSLRATPFLDRTETELAACGLHAEAAHHSRRVLDLTSRETEVAHLIGRGMSNPEVATELFVSRKAVEYHLGNIYAKCGLRGRQELRRYVAEWQQPAMA